MDGSYLIDREELLRLRSLKLFASIHDYVFVAFQIDFPKQPHPSVDVAVFCERWSIDAGAFYKALGALQQKGVLSSIASQVSLEVK